MTKAEDSPPLTAQQAHALFDILTHAQVYNEIQKFKYPDAIQNYGHPFAIEDGKPSTSPLLQSLLEKFILPLPGLQNVKEDFWQKRCQILVENLGAAELSESYDKGAIGSRRTLATACSTVIEYPARGCLGGLASKSTGGKDAEYDASDADDLIRAWEDFGQELVHGDMLDHLFDKAAETGDLNEHSDLVKAAHEYLLINLASFLHHIMVHSPDGPYLARVIENVNKLVPYMAVRQALKVGNAATMINTMVRLVLAKLSVTSLTNWIGLSNSANEGMNLLQQIASTVIGWDINDLSKQASKKEKHKEAPSKEYFQSIQEHLKRSREVRDKARSDSQKESKSILAVIFENSNLDAHQLSEPQYDIVQDYMSINLSMKDRRSVEAVICQQQPDVLTQAVKDLVDAYDPIIRGIHNAYDLSAGLYDFQCFLDDFIKLAKPPTVPKSGKSNGSASPIDLPKVEDYVRLLRKHLPAFHRFLHAIAKNGGDVTQQYRDYTKQAVAHFRAKPPRPKGDLKCKSSNPNHPGSDAAGAMTAALNNMVSSLPSEQRTLVLQQLDDHTAYIMAMDSVSRDRLRTIIANTSPTTSASSPPPPANEKGNGTRFGPGLYLVRWQNLIDSTLITPALPYGPVRTGRDPSVRSKAGVDVSGEKKVVDMRLEDGVPEAPNTEKVVDILGPKFRELLDDAWVKGKHTN